MQNSFLILSILILLSNFQAHSAETSCGKDPAATQKKMTHILRSIACSQAKSMKDCEAAAGLASNTTPAGMAGAALMGKVSEKFRPANLAGCAFANFEIRNSVNAFLNVIKAESAFAGVQQCHLALPEYHLNLTTNGALRDVEARIAHQKAEIAKQAKAVQDYADAAESADKAVKEFKVAERAYFATDPELKRISENLDAVREQIRLKNAEMATMAQNSSKYATFQREVAALNAQRSALIGKLSERKALVPYTEPIRAELSRTSGVKGAAEAKLKSIQKALGDFSAHEKLLQTQNEKLADLYRVRTEYQTALRSGKITSLEGGRNVLDRVARAGAVSEDHAKSLAHIDFMLDHAERESIIGSQRVASSSALRAASQRAMDALGRRAAGRIGIKVIGGVILAATGPLAMAAEVGIEIGLLGAEPSDAHCLDDSHDKLMMAHLTQFTQKNKCKSTPIVSDINEFRKIFDLPADEQLRFFNNPEFCKWVESVFDVHSPKMNATCQPNGANIEILGGKKIQYTLGENGYIKQFNSYGVGQEPDDFMYSVYFDENGAPKNLGVFATDRQYLMERSFDANAFKLNFQRQYPFYSASSKVGMNENQYQSMKLGYNLQTLAITEIKSCCNPLKEPTVEDSTCYSRYGIKAKAGSPKGNSNSDSSDGNRIR